MTDERFLVVEEPETGASVRLEIAMIHRVTGAPNTTDATTITTFDGETYTGPPMLRCFNQLAQSGVPWTLSRAEEPDP